ncbi:hypothetical protein IBL26_18930 [Roseomonas aerophila]|uniref:Uncharacterized protein n=1 Tax=Teichococcus aerophilus TaxID=1224513 RepID=A0ABR7RRN3_9PROT|nr:hypothetical protein [Pseudoroseomonas aerophila]MBC9208929.1 hypothetical protein [Pseudoroseomonas aerophila]
MKTALVALLTGLCKLLRALVVIPLLVVAIAFFLVLGLLVGAGVAALIGFLIALSITIGGTVLVVEGLKR